MYLSGTNAPSSTVSSLRVARMPRTSHVSLIVKLPVPRGRKACTTLGADRIAGIEPVEAEPGPDRRQAAERLPAGECVAAVHPLRLGDGHHERRFVAALGVTGGKDFAGGGLLEHPLARSITGPPELRRHAHPVVVHVRAERSGWSVACEAAGLARDVGEREAEAPELLRDGHTQVAGLRGGRRSPPGRSGSRGRSRLRATERLEGSCGHDAGRHMTDIRHNLRLNRNDGTTLPGCAAEQQRY